VSEFSENLLRRWEKRHYLRLMLRRANAKHKPVCGWCADGLCEDHDRDCTFRNLPISCACPNRNA